MIEICIKLKPNLKLEICGPKMTKIAQKINNYEWSELLPSNAKNKGQKKWLQNLKTKHSSVTYNLEILSNSKNRPEHRAHKLYATKNCRQMPQKIDYKFCYAAFCLYYT